jgi:hypothetical protein
VELVFRSTARNEIAQVEHAGEFGYGDVWTWVAIDADSKLVPTWGVGRRDSATAHAFVRDLAARLTTRVQLTTDGHKVYLEAIDGAFGSAIDYAMLVKMYEGGLHQLRGAPEPHDADADAPLHPPDQRLLQKVRQPQGYDRPALRALQFLAAS